MTLNTGFICGPKALSFRSTSTHLPPIFWHSPLTGRSPGHLVSYIIPVLLDLSNPSSSRINLLGLPHHQSACLLSGVEGTNKSSRLCNQQGVNKSVLLLMNSSIHLWYISLLNAYLIGVSVFLERGREREGACGNSNILHFSLSDVDYAFKAKGHELYS